MANEVEKHLSGKLKREICPDQGIVAFSKEGRQGQRILGPVDSCFFSLAICTISQIRSIKVGGTTLADVRSNTSYEERAKSKAVNEAASKNTVHPSLR